MDFFKKIGIFRSQNTESPAPAKAQKVKNDLEDTFIRDPRGKLNAYGCEGRILCKKVKAIRLVFNWDCFRFRLLQTIPKIRLLFRHRFQIQMWQ